jgi:hypothetical protein
MALNRRLGAGDAACHHAGVFLRRHLRFVVDLSPGSGVASRPRAKHGLPDELSPFR